MPNSLVLQNYTLESLIQRDDIRSTRQAILNQLNNGNITGILNAFLSNTLVTEFGYVYFKVNGLNNILRTSVSGLERAYVYQGVPEQFSPSEIISFNGDDYISRYELIKLIEYRLDNVPSAKTKLYLEIVKEIYDRVVNYPDFTNLKNAFIEKVQEKRSSLKAARMTEYNIMNCEFTNAIITRDNIIEYEFAHLDAVAHNPFLALNIDNGVIIHKNIHLDMTKKRLNTAQDIYNYCIEHGYLVDWAKVFK